MKKRLFRRFPKKKASEPQTLSGYIKAHYEQYDEQARFSTQHGQVEFLTTMRYIERYLKAGMRVLEVGAGTGRYSIALAKKGFTVDAVELVEHNIEVFRSRIPRDLSINLRQGNAMDLSFYADETFDMTLILGLLYHLFDKEDKRKAVSEALRVTKTGGVIFFAYCMNEATIFNWGFLKKNIQKGLENGVIDAKTFHCLSNPSLIFELYRKEDIDELIAGLPVERLHFLATDLMANYFLKQIDAMDQETFNLYLRYHFSICERPDVTGLFDHTLDILRKTHGVRG